MTGPVNWASLEGARLVEGDVPLPKIWQRLHDNATQWVIMANAGSAEKNLSALDKIDTDLLTRLSMAAAPDWRKMCEGAGITQMGAVGLSWCAGASLSDVWSMWSMAGQPLLPLPAFLRPARLLNPDLVGTGTKLSEIMNGAETDPFLACARCARAGAALEIDLSERQMSELAPEVLRFVLDAIEGGSVPIASARPLVLFLLSSNHALANGISQNVREKCLRSHV